MQLHQLRQNFSQLDAAGQTLFIQEYRARRYLDMQKTPTYGKTKKKPTKMEAMGFTPEEVAIAKQLGLKPKDILALKQLTT